MSISNCLLVDKSHPQWGDAHSAFNMEGSEFGTDDIIDLFKLLFQMGYLKKGPTRKLPTISLEVKPLPDGDRCTTFQKTYKAFFEAWKILELQI